MTNQNDKNDRSNESPNKVCVVSQPAPTSHDIGEINFYFDITMLLTLAVLYYECYIVHNGVQYYLC